MELVYCLFQTSGVSTNGLVGMNKDMGDWIGCECGDLVVVGKVFYALLGMPIIKQCDTIIRQLITASEG